MSEPQYLRQLNPHQREAVEHFEGPLLVLAGAGSGKTRVLTARAAHLVQEHGVPPHRILALTFTNKAAGEMRERLRRLLGERPSGLWAGTFHSFGAWLLRRHAERAGRSHRFTIYDADESLAQVKRILEALEVDPRRFRARGIRHEIEGAKHYLVTPESYAAMVGTDPEPYEDVTRRVYARYQRDLRRQDAVDFGDLLMLSVALLRDHPDVRRRYRNRFSFVLVDEYQDTNHAQYRLVQLTGEEHGNVMVVGDDDQSIYGWRGADLRNILEFESDFGGCRTVRLERNYRSTGNILDAANAVIAHNRNRKEKTLFTDRPAGEEVRVVRAGSDRAEARWIAAEIDRRAGSDGLAHGEVAVLYRTNAQSRVLEDAVRRRGIPYQIVGGLRFYERREIKDLLAYLRLIANPRDRAAFERAVNRPKRGVGEVTRSRLVERARDEGTTPLALARRATDVPELPTSGARSLEAFADLVDRHRDRADRLSASDLLRDLVEELEFLRLLKEEGPEGQERAENVEELISAAAEVDERGTPPAGSPGAAPDDVELSSLDRFLQEVALVTDVDRHDLDADAVSLMTLHNSKGLEFSHVFLAGMEEGLCPHSRSYGTEEDMEEERRLFYVGLTRARDAAFLTHAETRRRFGRSTFCSPSPFLDELPPDPVVRVRAEETEAGRRERGAGPPAGASALSWQDLSPGDPVEHPRFGRGRVVEIDDGDEDPRVVVDFQDGGRKRLAARYADLSARG